MCSFDSCVHLIHLCSCVHLIHVFIRFMCSEIQIFMCSEIHVFRDSDIHVFIDSEFLRPMGARLQGPVRKKIWLTSNKVLSVFVSVNCRICAGVDGVCMRASVME